MTFLKFLKKNEATFKIKPGDEILIFSNESFQRQERD